MKTKSKQLVIWLAFGVVAVGNCFGQTTPPSAAAPAADKPAATAASAPKTERANEKAALVRFGGMDANPMKFETGNADFRFPLRIESTGQGEAKDVTLVVHPLWGPDGKSSEVVCRIGDKPCAGEKINLVPGQAIEGAVAVKLGGVGTYSAWVTLTQAGHLESRLVEIKRLLRDTTFNVTGGEQATDGTLWVTIVEAAAEATKLSRPGVLTLTRNQKNKPATQAKFKSLVVSDESGKQVTESESLDLAAGQSRRLMFAFLDLEPGEYAGKLQFTALNGSKAKEFEIKQLTARWAAWVALIPILIGAVVSHFLREWATRYRPMLVKRQSIVALMANLDDAVQPLLPLEDAEARVEASVRKQLDVLERTLDADATSATDAKLAALTLKVEVLPFWVLARRRVGALEPTSLRVQFRDALLSGENFLSNARSEATDPSIETLRKLDGTITAAVRVELTKQVKELHDQVEGQIQSANHAQHLSRLMELRPLLADLEGAVESDDKSVRDLLADARSKFVRALIADFRQSLDEPAPATIEQADWTSLKDKLAGELDKLAADASAQTLTEAYRAALRSYVETLAGLLANGVRKRTSIVQASRIADADKAGFLAELQSIDGTLKTIQQEARDPAKVAKASGDLEVVITRLSTLADGYLQVAQAPLGAAIGAGAAGKVNPGASVPEGLSDDARQQMPERPAKVDARSRAERLWYWIHTGDAGVTIAAGAIALVLGLKAVWADNPVWGGFDDWLIALLWGLGLHQGASGVFEGIAGLKRKFV